MVMNPRRAAAAPGRAAARRFDLGAGDGAADRGTAVDLRFVAAGVAQLAADHRPGCNFDALAGQLGVAADLASDDDRIAGGLEMAADLAVDAYRAAGQEGAPADAGRGRQPHRAAGRRQVIADRAADLDLAAERAHVVGDRRAHLDRAAGRHDIAAHRLAHPHRAAGRDHVALDLAAHLDRAAGQVQVFADGALPDHGFAGVLGQHQHGGEQQQGTRQNRTGRAHDWPPWQRGSKPHYPRAPGRGNRRAAGATSAAPAGRIRCRAGPGPRAHRRRC
ncbi:MAG: hypothetical protein MZW92_38795 [Comamonadaceae bacterium]|nr:hypothetical protein [Comamonadaceae bacterium]